MRPMSWSSVSAAPTTREDVERQIAVARSPTTSDSPRSRSDDLLMGERQRPDERLPGSGGSASATCNRSFDPVPDGDRQSCPPAAGAPRAGALRGGPATPSASTTCVLIRAAIGIRDVRVAHDPGDQVAEPPGVERDLVRPDRDRRHDDQDAGEHQRDPGEDPPRAVRRCVGSAPHRFRRCDVATAQPPDPSRRSGLRALTPSRRDNRTCVRRARRSLAHVAHA